MKWRKQQEVGDPLHVEIDSLLNFHKIIISGGKEDSRLTHMREMVMYVNCERCQLLLALHTIVNEVEYWRNDTDKGKPAKCL